MNNIRIRYQTIKPGVLQSRRRFTTATGQEVLVELDLNQKKYRVLDSVTGVEVASGGNTKNLSVLKIQSKRGLTALGVTFAEETRTRSDLTDANR
jgi:hypothetical protein